jgi:hypothetical protein
VTEDFEIVRSALERLRAYAPGPELSNPNVWTAKQGKEALARIESRLEELKDGIIAVEAADEAWQRVGDVDQLPAALGALYSLLHPEPQRGGDMSTQTEVQRALADLFSIEADFTEMLDLLDFISSHASSAHHLWTDDEEWRAKLRQARTLVTRLRSMAQEGKEQ